MRHNIIRFPQPKARTRKPHNIDGIKYFTNSQIKLLRRTARDKAATDKLTNIREWMMIDLLTTTGLRVSEAANLRIQDLKIDYGQSRIYVRNGKYHLSGHIVINDSLKKHLKHYMKWKATMGEPIGEDDFVFVGQRGPVTSQAIQQTVKKYLKQLNLYESGKSVHSLRHSYAVELYRRENDIRTVQKQLRHTSIQSTQIYADVTQEDIQRQVKNMWR